MAKNTQQSEVERARELMQDAILEAAERKMEVEVNLVTQITARHRDEQETK